jgi:hypothetical protein
VKKSTQGGPNEHGVLEPTETVVIPGLPRGCKAVIRLSERDGVWHLGYEFTSAKRGESGPCKLGVRSWSARDAALDTGFRWARGFFEEERVADAVKIISLRLDDEAESPLSEATPPSQQHVGPMDTKIALSKRPLIHRPLKELTIHAAIADDPRMAPKDPRYVAMKTAWSEQGGCPPIYVTASGAIVDGRHRYWWLVDADEDTAPCIEVSEDEVFTIILGAIAGRNHQTQGQRAYFAAAKLGPALEAAKVRRDDQLRRGGKVKLAPLPTADEFAEQLHLGRNLLFQARRLHEVFADGKPGAKLRKEWEPKILDAEDPVGLGAALAGIAGASATKGKGKPDRNSALNNWEAGWKNLVNPAKKFASWDEEQRDYAAESLRKTLTKLPGEVLELVIASARAAKKAVDAQSATPTEG